MTPFRKLSVYGWLFFALVVSFPVVHAQQVLPTSNAEELRQEVRKLRQQVQVLDNRISLLKSSRTSDTPINSNVNTGGVAMLFGAFCALWAQNTKRNSLLWFFFGAIFNVIAVLVLLYKNST